MKRALYVRLSTLLFMAGCYGGSGTEPTSEPSESTCGGLTIEWVDEAVTPPANVATVARITDCQGQSLGRALRPDEFALYEDGELLEVAEADRLLEPLERPMSELTLIALDLSGSVHEADRMDSMLEAAKLLVSELVPTHQVAITGFDGRADLVTFSYFSSETEELYQALEDARIAPMVDPSTNLYGAVLSGLSILDHAVEARSGGHQIAHGNLVIFTDGKDQASRVSEEVAEHAVELSQHSIFAIGLGSNVDYGALRTLGQTSATTLDETDALLAAFDSVAEEVKALAMRDYLISYCTPARAGDHRFEVVVRHQDLVGTAELGFVADGFGAGCNPAHSPLKF